MTDQLNMTDRVRVAGRVFWPHFPPFQASPTTLRKLRRPNADQKRRRQLADKHGYGIKRISACDWAPLNGRVREFFRGTEHQRVDPAWYQFRHCSWCRHKYTTSKKFRAEPNHKHRGQP